MLDDNEVTDIDFIVKKEYTFFDYSFFGMHCVVIFCHHQKNGRQFGGARQIGSMSQLTVLVSIIYS